MAKNRHHRKSPASKPIILLASKTEDSSDYSKLIGTLASSAYREKCFRK